MMSTNEERHTIAEEMRQRMREGYSFSRFNIAEEIGKYEGDYDDPYKFDEDCWSRLADLIEPGEQVEGTLETINGDIPSILPEAEPTVDRDELLRIAEQMEKSSERRRIRGFARRIREACGK